jgi:hypothetical protein
MLIFIIHAAARARMEWVSSRKADGMNVQLRSGRLQRKTSGVDRSQAVEGK